MTMSGHREAVAVGPRRKQYDGARAREDGGDLSAAERKLCEFMIFGQSGDVSMVRGRNGQQKRRR